MHVDVRPGEPLQYRFAVAAVCRHGRTDDTVIGECFQGALRHCVDREWRGQGLDV